MTAITFRGTKAELAPQVIEPAQKMTDSLCAYCCGKERTPVEAPYLVRAHMHMHFAVKTSARTQKMLHVFSKSYDCVDLKASPPDSNGIVYVTLSMHCKCDGKCISCYGACNDTGRVEFTFCLEYCSDAVRAHAQLRISLLKPALAGYRCHAVALRRGPLLRLRGLLRRVPGCGLHRGASYHR